MKYLLLLILLLGLVACGSPAQVEVATPTAAAQTADVSEPVATSVPQPTATDVPTLEPSPTPSLAVGSLKDVNTAVVQIEAVGSFVDPEVGLMLNAAGAGSGFIIDPSGLAVTNNHVVTGAAIVRVYVTGEDTPRNARILAVSECSDLAVIDIDGEDLPYLEWFDGELQVGLDVYAAGFPLGDTEYTLTRGIISKARANGETSWASVDTVLEHDATINPGNSGGPLVTADGLVVGVNYAGASQTNQYFAIARDEALQVIDQLREAVDVNSIGVNGTAVSDGSGLSGIWVASVESGSPADEVGVEAGDIIIGLENLVLATDGTMADYCDILRTRTADQPMQIEVLRYATQEVLEGQLNGDPLAVTTNFGQALEAEVPDDTGAGVAVVYEYAYVTDDSGLLNVEIPTVWSDLDGSPWIAGDEEVGLQLVAAPNLEEFYGSWTTPGMFFGASENLAAVYSQEQLLDDVDYSDQCDYGGREPYEDAFYSGFYDLYQNCGGEEVIYLVLSAMPENRAYIILVEVQVVTDADLDALDHILNSFFVAE